MEVTRDTLQYVSIRLEDGEKPVAMKLLVQRFAGPDSVVVWSSILDVGVELRAWLTAEEVRSIKELFFLSGFGEVDIVPVSEEYII